MPKVLNSQQIRRFHEQGFIAPVRVFPESLAREIRERFESFENRFPEHTAKLDVKANLLCPWVAELCCYPRLLDIVEDLVGPDILCTSSNFRTKHAHSRSHAGWHQDGKYIQIEPSLILVIVALTEFSEDSGCVRFVPGSHRWGYLSHSESNPDPDSILDRQQHITESFDDSLAVPAILSPGEMSIHQAGTIHGSRPNQADFRRVGWIADYLPTHGRVVSGKRAGAMLMRGHDRFGHFCREPVPEVEAGHDALANWEHSVGLTGATIYADSSMKPLALRD